MAYLASLVLPAIAAWSAAPEIKPPPVNTDASKAFLSTITITKAAEEFAPVNQRVIAPNAGRIAGELYYATPVAVHVPFEVPFEGRVVRIHSAVSVIWPGGGTKFMPGMILPGAYGIYRQDRKTLPAGSVVYEKSYQPDSTRWQPMWFNANGAVPCWVNGTPPPKGQYQALQVGWYNEKNAGVSPQEAEMESPIVLKQAEPGEYTFWCSILSWGNNDGWPQNLNEETLPATLRVTLLITAAEDRLNLEQRHAYLFHGGPRPAGMGDNSLYRTYEIDLPLKLHRDGWVFDHAEIVPAMAQVAQKQLKEGDLATDIQSATKTAGPSVTMSLKTVTTDKKKVVFQDAFTWDVALPSFIDDENIGDVLAGGSEQHQWDQAEARLGVTPLLRPSWSAMSFEGTDKRVDKDGVSLMVATGSRWGQQSMEFDNAHGSPAEKSRWWFTDPRPSNEAPVAGAAPHRLRYYGRAPYDKLPQETLGSRLVINLGLGPWNVDGFYRRRSETAVNSSAAPGPSGPIAVVSNEDPFWKWFARFSSLLEAQLPKVAAARDEATTEGLEVQRLRRSNLILLAGGAESDEEDLQMRFWDTVIGLRKPDATLSETAWQEKMKRVAEQGQARLDALKKVDDAAREAKEAFAVIMKELDAAVPRYEAAHPEVLIYRLGYKDLSDRLALDLAVAAGDYDAFQAAVKGLEERGGISSDVRLAEAKLLCQKNDPAQALSVVRYVLEGEPGNVEAKELCTQLEASFIQSCLRKSAGAIESARGVFYQYLKDRGYNKDEPKDSWLGQIWAPLRIVNSETAMMAFTGGVSNALLTRFYIDKPGEEERAKAADEEAMTRAYGGLQMVLRLSLRGHTLSEIFQMNAAALRSALPLQKASGQPFNDQEIAGLGALIQEVKKTLPEMAPLLQDQPELLKAAMAKGYWDSKDVGNTWAEYFGDYSSAKNLLVLLLPYSEVTVVRRATAAANAANAANAAQKTAEATEIVTGAEYLREVSGWNAAVRYVGGTRLAQPLVTRLAALNEYRKTVGKLSDDADAAKQLVALLDKSIWASGKFTAFLVVQVGTSELQSAVVNAAEKKGIDPAKANLLIEALLLVAGDDDLMAKLFQGDPSTCKAVSTLLHQRYLPAVKAAQAKLEATYTRNVRVRQILATRLQGQTLRPEDVDYLTGALRDAKLPARLIPDGDALHDTEIALTRCAEETRGPNPVAGQGPLQAADEMKPRVESAKQAVEQRVERAETAARKVDALATTAAKIPVVTPAKSAPPKLPDWYSSTSAHATPLSERPSGPKMQQGDQHLRDGETGEAAQAYEEAQAGSAPGSPEYDLAERRKELARKILGTPRDPIAPGPLAAARELTAEEIAGVFARESTWRQPENLLGEQGAFSQIYRDGDYLVKELAVGGEPPKAVSSDLIEMSALAEVVAGDLAHHLGLDVPAVHARILRNVEGEAQKVQFIYRVAGSKSLSEANPELVYQFHKELSQMDVLANFLNDYDRHCGNYLVSEGRLIGIDWGMADPCGIRARSFGALGKNPDVNPVARNYLQGDMWGRDHWFGRARRQMTQPNPEKVSEYKLEGQEMYLRYMGRQKKGLNTLVSQECLSFEDGEPILRKIQGLMADETKLRSLLERSFQKLYADPADIDQLVRVEIEKTVNQLIARSPGRTFDASTRQQIETSCRAAVEQMQREKIETAVGQAVENLQWRNTYLEPMLKDLDERNFRPLGGPSPLLAAGPKRSGAVGPPKVVGAPNAAPPVVVSANQPNVTKGGPAANTGPNATNAAPSSPGEPNATNAAPSSSSGPNATNAAPASPTDPNATNAAPATPAVSNPATPAVSAPDDPNVTKPPPASPTDPNATKAPAASPADPNATNAAPVPPVVVKAPKPVDSAPVDPEDTIPAPLSPSDPNATNAAPAPPATPAPPKVGPGGNAGPATTKPAPSSPAEPNATAPAPAGPSTPVPTRPAPPANPNETQPAPVPPKNATKPGSASRGDPRDERWMTEYESLRRAA